MALALLLCSAFLAEGIVLVKRDKQLTGQVRASLVDSQAHVPARASAQTPDKLERAGEQRLDPEQWPLRASVDEVVATAGQEALEAGILLHSISVSHQTASTQAWGKVMLDVSAAGSYAALKAWQGALQERFPALAVQALRMQSGAATPNGLEAQWTWVLHVRD